MEWRLNGIAAYEQLPVCELKSICLLFFQKGVNSFWWVWCANSWWKGRGHLWWKIITSFRTVHINEYFLIVHWLYYMDKYIFNISLSFVLLDNLMYLMIQYWFFGKEFKRVGIPKDNTIWNFLIIYLWTLLGSDDKQLFFFSRICFIIYLFVIIYLHKGVSTL